jgi:hypothetical protein
MKSIINKSIVLGLMLGFFSCTELKEEPIGLLAPESFFKVPADVEAGVLGAYSHITNEQFYGRKLVLSLLLRGDMADIGDRNTPGRRQQVNDFNMDSNNGMITAFWPRAYKIIGAANAAVAGADLVVEPADKIDALRAEAVFLRAWTYYHLVRVFGDIPYIDLPFINNPEDDQGRLPKHLKVMFTKASLRIWNMQRQIYQWNLLAMSKIQSNSRNSCCLPCISLPDNW